MGQIPSLIYAPAIKVIIATRQEGLIDVSDDLVSGSMTLTENEGGQFSFRLANHRRKYDGVFSPNDRISVQMKRLGPSFMQNFAGYLDDVPFLSTYPRTIDVAATCTLKRLRNRLWDSGSLAASNLLQQSMQQTADSGNPDSQADGGNRSRIILLVNEVGGWPKDNIHVGQIPANWFGALGPLEEEVATILGVSVGGQRVNLGQAYINGISATESGSTTSATPTGDAANLPKGAGAVPSASAKAVSSPALSSWQCSMRWGYYVLAATGQSAPWITPAEDEQKSITWWSEQKILVVNPKNNRAVVCSVGPWGPVGSDKIPFGLELSPSAWGVLQAGNGDTLDVRFADKTAPLGEFIQVTPGAVGTSIVSDWSIPAGANPKVHTAFAWHPAGNGNIPVDQLQQIVTPAGGKLLLHPVAAASYNAMRDEALKAGIRLSPTDGYRSHAEEVALKDKKGEWAAAVGTSIHGWGMALDMGPGVNTFSGAGYQWMTQNGGRYGWVNPPWAKYGKGNSKVATPTSEQAAIMATILSVGQAITNADPTLTPRGRLQVLLAGFETGWVESHMTNIPHGDVAGPDSRGVFQQRSKGWGTEAERMDVTHAATSFFQRAVGSTYKNNKGTAGQLAQSVQSSGVPDAYDKMRDQALASLSSFGIDASGVDGGGVLTGDEPWHWEFWAGLKYVTTAYADLPKVVGGADPNYTPTQGAPTGSNGVAYSAGAGGQLVDINSWYAAPDPSGESEVLVGYRALMNDDPLLDFVASICKATMRSYMAAPNGDFISWFPDYFGHFGTAGRMTIRDIEIAGDGFTITWSDRQIVTHQFVMGALHSFSYSNLPGGIIEEVSKLSLSGVVSIDFPKVIAALLNFGRDDPRFGEWLEPEKVYQRYGARKDFQTISTIVGAQAEFWCACYEFMKKWAQQFSTRAYFTFMPEIYPGMILEFPSGGFQAYCASVTHSFDFQGSGFQTTAVIIAPSAMDGSGLPFVRGGSDLGPVARVVN